MSDKSQQRALPAHSDERRRFLKKAGLAGTSAAAAAALPGIVAAAPDTGASGTEPSRTGYRETAHVRDYYRIASE
ncbi:twin-arginine translocation signal domain-containing protein [Thioalkalivibrio paradoxus]|uniref:Transcriptional initiation protein Tat n=1 Tax=Thioalkalivibrio paradoxus ARh 1 TaxID=713585 RepID=W0DF60_9GAMM|nr:twin-arginine translocation signal domain-containing protein [Thioalkalivibrio paradoxus]AHE97259.1 transcriptional initiation protein Tat [Thioalkalivibrio paradoxus ARh 1]